MRPDEAGGIGVDSSHSNEEIRLILDQKLKLVVHINNTIKIRSSGSPNLPGEHHDLGVVEEIAKPKTKKPSMYKVIMLNDDYTPMEFVIEVLQTFFSMNREKATQTMLAVHTVGKATCGIFTRDIAETKSLQVNQYAQDCQHPLVSQIEATD